MDFVANAFKCAMSSKQAFSYSEKTTYKLHSMSERKCGAGSPQKSNQQTHTHLQTQTIQWAMEDGQRFVVEREGKEREWKTQ